MHVSVDYLTVARMEGLFNAPIGIGMHACVLCKALLTMRPVLSIYELEPFLFKSGSIFSVEGVPHMTLLVVR